ncbi:mucin-2 protein [Nocardioides caricicola]|uniref:Mucin-2 protein n=1 Tax=Nocardioides caricicola TaxID=634770 RepID=A0ABW0N3S7_9ACTN
MAEHRHKRETTARRKPRAALVAGPLAVMATVSAVTLGVLAADPEARDLVAQDAASDLSAGLMARDTVSRSDSRVERKALQKAFDENAELTATAAAVKKAETKLWTTAPLNLWSDSGKDAVQRGEIAAGKPVLVTGRKADGRVEIVVDGESRWVTEGYLSEDEPVGGDCTNGTSVPSGVSPNIVKVHEAVCARFPEITTYGTFRGDGEHSQGIAVDIMVSGDRGWEVAEFIRANYAELGVSYLIYAQSIWSVERGGEGWRGMSDRGSATANHYDHVHVTTY